VTYTGPTRSSANCAGDNPPCPVATPLLNCFDQDQCSGIAATCTRCNCTCE
jgi:hypothetical protein